MTRKRCISLSDILLATLLLGVWVSITIPYISGIGPGSRSSVLERDLRKMRSWIERCTRRGYGQPSAGRGETLESLLATMAGKTDSEGDSDSTSVRYPRRLPVNRSSSRRTARTGGIAADTRIAVGRLDTGT